MGHWPGPRAGRKSWADTWPWVWGGRKNRNAEILRAEFPNDLLLEKISFSTQKPRNSDDCFSFHHLEQTLSEMH